MNERTLRRKEIGNEILSISAVGSVNPNVYFPRQATLSKIVARDK